MKIVLATFLLFFLVSTTFAQGKLTFHWLKYILSEKVKNKDLDSIMLNLGYGFKELEKWPAQTNFHYHNNYPKGDKNYSSIDISILLMDDNKFYIAYTTKSNDDIEDILKVLAIDTAYKINNVYLSHHNQEDQFIGKEYKNGVYSVAVQKFHNKYGTDYSISVGLDSEYKKTMVPLTPDRGKKQ